MSQTNPKKKVLVLPSFWPTRSAPVVGAQVQEQTQLLAGEFEIKVFYCLAGMGWKRYVWYSAIRLLTGKQRYQSCESGLISGSLDTTGVYFFQSKRFSYKKNLALETAAYTYLLKKTIADGWKPDLIHARTAEFAGRYAARIAAAFNIRLLLTENTSFIMKHDPRIERFRDFQNAIESADVVAVVSSYVKGQLLVNDFRCNPVIVGNWIDETRFRQVETPVKRPFTILSIGTTGFIKDWPTFFRAVQYLVQDLGCTDIRLVLAVTYVFDEESRNYIDNMAREHGLAEHCEVLYQVPRAEMATLFHRASVLVSTSISETFGIATCEAMFCGIPVVATANGGIDDIMSDASGIKVPIGDHIAVAAALKDIYDGKKYFDPATIRGSVLSKFGTAAFRQRLIDLYHKTMEI